MVESQLLLMFSCSGFEYSARSLQALILTCYCLLVVLLYTVCWSLVFSCSKRLTVPDMGMSASALYGPSVTGRKPPCTFRGGKLICGKFKPLCCSPTCYACLNYYCKGNELSYKLVKICFICTMHIQHECPVRTSATAAVCVCVRVQCGVASYNLILAGFTVSIIPDEASRTADW